LCTNGISAAHDGMNRSSGKLTISVLFRNVLVFSVPQPWRLPTMDRHWMYVRMIYMLGSTMVDSFLTM
jgi:hypothetical protein